MQQNKCHSHIAQAACGQWQQISLNFGRYVNQQLNWRIKAFHLSVKSWPEYKPQYLNGFSGPTFHSPWAEGDTHLSALQVYGLHPTITWSSLKYVIVWNSELNITCTTQWTMWFLLRQRKYLHCIFSFFNKSTKNNSKPGIVYTQDHWISSSVGNERQRFSSSLQIDLS